MLPECFSPLLELWYLTNAAATRKRSPNQLRPVLSRNSLFFPLVSFKHSLQTWLVQAGAADLTGHSNNNNNNNHDVNNKSSNSAENDCISINMCNSNNWPVSTLPQEAGVGAGALAEACHMLLMHKPSGLPNFASRVITKLSLALPDFLERTLYTQHLTFHRGSPVTLAHTWETFLQPQLRARQSPCSVKPRFSLEIVFGQTDVEESSLRLDAMIILFDTESWVLWIGTVAPFPACKHGGTLTLKTLDVDISISSLREDVGDIKSVFNTEFGVESINHRWMLQKLFPGVCHMIHAQKRQGLVDQLDSRIELLVGHIQAISSNRTLSQSSFTSRESYLHPKLRAVLRTVGIVPRNLHSEISTRDTLTQRCPLQYIESNSLAHAYTAHLPTDIRLSLHAMFNQEVQTTLGNRKSHVIVCETCSQLWFPKRATLDACIACWLGLPQIPVSLWPYHALVKALEVVDSALEACAGLSQ